MRYVRGVAWAALLALGVGCGGGKAVKSEDGALVTPKPAPLGKLVAYHAQLSQTWDDAAIQYLGVERNDLTPDEQTAFGQMASERQGQLLPTDASEAPERLRGPQRFTLLTVEGPRALEPSTGLLMYGGASEDHFIHAFPPPALSDAARAGVMVAVPLNPALPKTARIHAGVAVAPDSEVGAKLIALVRSRLAAQHSEALGQEGGDEQPYAELVPAEHVQIVRGSFGGQHVLAVAYAVPRSADGSDISQGHLAGLFFADAQGGAVLDIVASSTFEADRIVSLADLEGDGRDELIFESSYYEGSFTYITRIVEGKVEILELAGDGA